MHDNETPAWRLPDWDGPKVEARPAVAGPEWPADAVERVTFRKEDFPAFPSPEQLPFTRYYGVDGWPLETPAEARPKLDPRCQAALRRYPWVHQPELWEARDWVDEFGDYQSHLLTNAEVGAARSLLSSGNPTFSKSMGSKSRRKRG